jgi:hypothetical protein
VPVTERPLPLDIYRHTDNRPLDCEQSGWQVARTISENTEEKYRISNLKLAGTFES